MQKQFSLVIVEGGDKIPFPSLSIGEGKGRCDDISSALRGISLVSDPDVIHL